MFDAYVQLRRKHRLPVLPIGVYLRVGLNGIGVDAYEEHFWELRPLRFEYLYVGLPALDAVEYVTGENWLGVALSALMTISKDRVAWLGAEALRRIQAAPLDDQQRFLLGECVQAYLPLSEEQQRKFEKLIASENYKGVQAMNVTWYEKGIEKGIESGRREALREMLEERFGALPSLALAKLEQSSLDQLRALQRSLAKAKSLRDLGLA
ncbi:MAG: hypothetical protein FJ271_02960 [Planctomycetes bacterium]|nr:hypothetical protein [Planctomycetota bacterium]